MPLNWIWERKQVTIEWDSNKNPLSTTTSLSHSKVIKVEEVDDNEKKITISIPVNWESIEITGTLAEIIKVRKQLEFEWKIPVATEHDDEATKKSQELKDITRWEFWGRWSSMIIDTVAENEKKKIAAAKQKKLIKDVVDSFKNWRATLVKTSEQSKQALLEVLIVSEEKIGQLFSKKSLQKTWKVLSKTSDVIGGIIEKWIYYAIPSIEWSLPHMKKKIYMTWKQLFDILSGKKVTPHNEDVKQEERKADKVQ